MRKDINSTFVMIHEIMNWKIFPQGWTVLMFTLFIFVLVTLYVSDQNSLLILKLEQFKKTVP